MSDSAIQQRSETLSTMGFTPTSLPQAIAFAEMLGRSGLVPRAIAGKPSDILVVLLTGHEFGLGPMASLRLLSVIDGKAVIGGEAYTAVVQASPECEFFRCIESTDKKATFEAKRRGEDKVHVFSWTIEQAARAGLLAKDNWKRYPEAMLRWRCASALAKLAFAFRFAGVYVEDEADEISATAATTGEAGGQVIDMRSTADRLADRAKAMKAEQSAKTATVDVKVEKPDPRNSAEDWYRAFVAMPETEWVGLIASLASGGILRPEEQKGFERARDERLTRRRAEAPSTVVGYAELKKELAYFEIIYDLDRLEKDKAYAAERQAEVNARKAKAAAPKTAAQAADEPLMLFGPHKGKPIRSLDGPTMLEQIAFGTEKLGTLKSEDLIAKVKWNIAVLQTEMKKREAALLDESPAQEPGASDAETL